MQWLEIDGGGGGCWVIFLNKNDVEDNTAS